jgi:hypothetical protein
MGGGHSPNVGLALTPTLLFILGMPSPQGFALH